MRRLDPTGSQTSEGSNQPTTQNQVVGSLKPLDLQRMQAILQDMEAQCALREGEMRSQVPVIGGWITRLRRFWISLAVRHYVLPALHQQSEHNAQMLLVLKEAVQSLITLQRQNEMLVQQNAALTRLRLMSEDEASISMVLQEINEMLVQQNAALTRLRLMSEDEASISMVLQEIVGKLTGRT